jgi:hypothetical protein
MGSVANMIPVCCATETLVLPLFYSKILHRLHNDVYLFILPFEIHFFSLGTPLPGSSAKDKAFYPNWRSSHYSLRKKNEFWDELVFLLGKQRRA